MSEKRLVRCNDPDCGYEWKSSASDPRCSDPHDICGRSRASPVESGQDTSTESQDNTASGTDTRTESSDSADGQSDDGSWSPLFDTKEERTGAADDAPEPPSIGQDDGDSADDEPSHEIPDLEPEDVRPFLVTAFGGPPTEGDEKIPGFASQQRGEHWALREHEISQLSRAYARVGNKYLPYIMAEYTVEGLALMTTAMIMAPRLQEDRRQKEMAKKRAKDTDVPEDAVRSDHEAEDSDDEQIDERINDLAESTPAGEDAWIAGANA